MKEYKIKLDSDSIEPEEALLEAVSPESKIEKPIDSGFFVVFYFLVIAVLVVFVITGMKFQVLDHSYFADLSKQNQFVNIPISPPRGLIYSKDGQILADNILTYNLWLVPVKISPENQQSAVSSLASVLSISESEINKAMEENKASASILLKEGISQEEKEKIESLNLPGTYVVESNIRVYSDGTAFSHLLGYIGPVSEEDLIKNDSYSVTDKIGLSGLERYYENFLRGKGRGILISRFEDKTEIQDSEKGNDLVLNIDPSLQSKLHRELVNVLRANGSKFGVALALDPRDGRILALVSLPSFDNNALSRGLNFQEYRSLVENSNKPFFNRVVSGKFSPGSTIKPLVALAALEEDVISPNKLINAPGFINIVNPYNPDIIYTFRDWKNHGWVDLRQAIAQSSDIYFYTVGGGYYDIGGLGIERLAKYLKMFKVDSVLGIDLPSETAGFVPTPEWKREQRKEIWYQGDTFNVSIGQGDLIVTPLWLTSYIGAVGNGEKLYRPYVGSKILDGSGNVLESFEPQILVELPFQKEDIKIVKEGMRLAAKEGTAKILNSLPIEVGAKSGTSEVIKGQSTNSWISVFAPYDNPEIVLTIMMDSGIQGSQLPTQIAARILSEYFNR